MSGEKPSKLNARLTRARVLMTGGRHDEGIEELRNAMFDATRLTPPEGRAEAEQILHFARENEVFDEVEDILESEALLSQLFGQDWK